MARGLLVFEVRPLHLSAKYKPQSVVCVQAEVFKSGTMRKRWPIRARGKEEFSQLQWRIRWQASTALPFLDRPVAANFGRSL